MGNSTTAAHSDARQVYVFPNRARFAEAAARSRGSIRGRGPSQPALGKVVRAVRSRATRPADDPADAAWLDAVGAGQQGRRLAELEEAVLSAAGVSRASLSDAERERLRAEAGQALAMADDGSEALRVVLARMAEGAGRGAP